MGKRLCQFLFWHSLWVICWFFVFCSPPLGTYYYGCLLSAGSRWSPAVKHSLFFLRTFLGFFVNLVEKGMLKGVFLCGYSGNTWYSGFSASVVFLDDRDNLNALLSRLVSLVADRIVTIGTIETIVFFWLWGCLDLEPSVQTKREKKGMKVEIMGFN